MCLYVTALNPTDAVTHGLLPAAARLGLPVVLLTDQPEAHAYPGVMVEHAEVRDAGAVVARVLELSGRHGAPAALLSNSDHLQTATSLAAELLSLPGKDFRATLRTKNKFLTRARLAEAGLDTVTSVTIGPRDDPRAAAEALPFPAVVKPREGVASEDARLVGDLDELVSTVDDIRTRRSDPLVAEEYLAGELRTYDTIGDGVRRHVFGSWRTTVGDPPAFTEIRLDWAPEIPVPVRAHLDAQLTALGVGFGACHTEFVIDGDRARIIEVNYRLIGDTMDLICCELLGVDLFAELIDVYLGKPLSVKLPDPVAVGRHARMDNVLATTAGTLTESPPAGVRETDGGARIGHRRLREVGVTAPVHGTNRDYLSAVYAIGPDRPVVDGLVENFIARNIWRISE
ncbi:biotin carboxylase [Herbihabitans rhizosphaerae]|uniref:Biotin carboxylase n=1 Tax=Herbihabitans rhizosphaerae TaxID=1872711 RepID=A0A4Q7KW10_9PSEU|nr:siderophore biosynthesis protein [Herbihabitans rhizosphaerae]RZS40855.1 biotin carboxylase [Herbihabitans rhizosphaerae]